MAEVDIQSVPKPQPEIRAKDDLVSKLDDLLGQYLNTLDEYQKAQQQLSKHLSAGFFSLAQANFNSSRTQYGQDYYDERMQASRKVTLTEEGSKIAFSLSTADAPASKQTPSEAENPSAAPDASPEDAPAESEAEASPPEEKVADDDETTKDRKTNADPLRWFGILVPPALRSAQASFIAGVEGPVPRLATLAKNLRVQEIEVGRLRKQINRL
ncbi:hypothetical protein BU26DRAFT_535927 [Trematosphaeria pertusa]|uniref:Vacuolar ATPase assembly protein VMA22 n=1 Tax=Trematosphaeria pertusa TaxID=390896 RepID=A0A6A6HRB1_9PLEO|nr:uncharacterized protein BU26DRAFT_535927 [Trematosphaeria pertusa]KAF2240409.1 hypothetical protein BU26DRAFT_535927 [Trematosphaeria pertusa]